MTPLVIKGKAEVLQALQGRLRSAQIMPLRIFSETQYKNSPRSIIEELGSIFESKTVIVRSAAAVEDSKLSSYAGHFTSVANVQADDPKAVRKAIEEVVNSYSEAQGQHQFFVQEQVLDISISGVLFTCDLDSLAPYYVINYDRSGSHDSVTSGTDDGLETYIRAHSSPNPPIEPEFEKLIELAEELQELSGEKYLDIEFAFDGNGQLFLLQVRPIVSESKSKELTGEQHKHYLDKIARKLEKITRPHPGILGEQGILSLMTDWNPAEMIGTHPRRLALSLYKELITDSIWAHQRNNYGYRDLRSFPLLISLIEQPYIDVRASFNSFIPKELSDDLSEKLVNFYISKLKETPTDHDKVEFNIVFSCYDFTCTEGLKELLDYGFTELELDRIKFALLRLTNGIVSSEVGLYQNDLAQLAELEQRCDEVINSQLSIIDQIYWLVENCKRYGTLPFAGLARAGFVAVQLLQSLVDTKLLSEQEKESFLSSLNTVGKQLAENTESLKHGQIDKEDFLSQFGHLRPGTYDILSKTYSEAFDSYFSLAQGPKGEKRSNDVKEFSLSEVQSQKLQELIDSNGLASSPKELMNFIAEAIEGREYGKFVFTKIVSKTLGLLERLGAKFDISREEMSWVDIQTVLSLFASLTTENVNEVLLRDIKKNKSFLNASKAIRLPQVLQSPKDVYDFKLGEVEPNFITTGRVTEVIVTEEDLLKSNLSNRIVLIQKADPGYDWIFSKKISGLITMYGGANSHMAIRCSELSIPAVIGCGEKNFAEWSESKKLEIDCEGKKVSIIEN